MPTSTVACLYFDRFLDNLSSDMCFKRLQMIAGIIPTELFIAIARFIVTSDYYEMDKFWDETFPDEALTVLKNM